MKFVMSYSCGKDSTLALHKMVEQGHTPVALLVMFNQDQERSWFHGVDRPLLEQIAASLELPLLLCPSSGEEYHLAFEEGLRRAMEMGAEACVFGDIDIEDNAAWCGPAARRWGSPPVSSVEAGSGGEYPGGGGLGLSLCGEVRAQ